MTLCRRLCVCIVVGCLLFGMSGCLSFLPIRQTDTTIDPDAYIEQYKDNARYNELSESLKECYGTVYTALTDSFDKDETVTVSQSTDKQKSYIGVSVALPHTLTDMTQIKALYNAVVYDNPQFFYVSNVYGLEGYQKDKTTYYNKILFTYTMDATTRKEAKKKLDSVITSIRQNAPNTTDDYEMELYLHDRLLERCSYDYDASKKGYKQFPHAYTAYAALVDGKAVCEGYSRAMQWLLKLYDIPCALVVGESLKNGEQHMWNYVTINGDSYHLDATWNDSGDAVRHNYFNVTTEQISVSHRIAENQNFLKSCTQTKDNYYHRNGLYVDTYQRQTIAAIIAQHVCDGKEQVELLFAKDKYDNALLFLKSRAAVNEIVNPYLADKGLKLWEYDLYGEQNEHILIMRKKK